MKVSIVLLLTLSLIAFASDVDKSAQSEWKPIVYEYLTPAAQKLVDNLDYVDSTNNILTHHLLDQLVMQNCKFTSVYKNDHVQVVIEELQSGSTHRLNFPKHESKVGQVYKRGEQNHEFYMAVTDNTEDVEGYTIEGATYTLEIKIEKATGMVSEVHVISNLKTIFGRGVLMPFGPWFGRKPVENGLDLICKSEPAL